MTKSDAEIITINCAPWWRLRREKLGNIVSTITRHILEIAQIDERRLLKIEKKILL